MQLIVAITTSIFTFLFLLSSAYADDITGFSGKSLQKKSTIHITNRLKITAETSESPPTMSNLTTTMSKHGCKLFSDLLVDTGAVKTFEDNIQSGLTIFCPVDGAVKEFQSLYKNLTKDGKNSLLLYHGVPIYQSLSMLRSNNGDMNTLATAGAKNYDFDVQNEGEQVTIRTKVSTVEVTGTLFDSQPVAILTINKVLQPKELFKVPAPAPAPASEKPAEAPKSAKKKKHPSPPAPEGPEASPADVKAEDSGSGASRVGVWIAIGLIASLFGSL